MALSTGSSNIPRPLRSLAASAVGLYLLVNAFLILCLVHPHNTHLQGQTDSHPASVCAWVHKTVASHVPSSGVNLPLISATLLVLLPLPQYAARLSSIRLTGRSPPLLAFV
ncbi:hypothetical protein MELA_00999 [Candidatus Methylomirabilis lanthanidiphila]|uniref:Uncharacterized protein n=1 Tax=Candidatus Methylomirabilis lanthanidiphila TaxID=2211376 RepID=A0A564ZHM4_9BACT|nr:hypothetical protein MELA_00999 [Candidatus Methylomirabilis lanthanidiphila]